jgi:hypothetical protein
MACQQAKPAEQFGIAQWQHIDWKTNSTSGTRGASTGLSAPELGSSWEARRAAYALARAACTRAQARRSTSTACSPNPRTRRHRCAPSRGPVLNINVPESQKPLQRRHFCNSWLSRDILSSITSVASPSITVARSLIHCSSVIGLSDIRYLPVACSSCQASRQCAGSRLLTHPQA